MASNVGRKVSYILDLRDMKFDFCAFFYLFVEIEEGVKARCEIVELNELSGLREGALGRALEDLLHGGGHQVPDGLLAQQLTTAVAGGRGGRGAGVRLFVVAADHGSRLDG